MVMLGLAYEHTASKSDQMGGNKEQNAVRRFVKEEVNCLNLGAGAKANAGGQSNKTQCQTCLRLIKKQQTPPKFT